MAFGAIVQGGRQEGDLEEIIQRFGAKAGRQEGDLEEAEEEIIQRFLNPPGYYKRQPPSYITSAYNRIRGMKKEEE